MIIDLLHTSDSYDIILNHYGQWDYVCPKCHEAHSLHRHGTYERNLTLLVHEEELSEIRMEILRLQCSSCKSTHAILTADMIPYFIYALPTFLKLIILCQEPASSVPKVEKRTGVSYQLLYYYIQLLTQYQERIQEIMIFEHRNDEVPGDGTFAIYVLGLTGERPPWFLKTYFQIFKTAIFLRRKSTELYPFHIVIYLSGKCFSTL